MLMPILVLFGILAMILGGVSILPYLPSNINFGTYGILFVGTIIVGLGLLILYIFKIGDD